MNHSPEIEEEFQRRFKDLQRDAEPEQDQYGNEIIDISKPPPGIDPAEPVHDLSTSEPAGPERDDPPPLELDMDWEMGD